MIKQAIFVLFFAFLVKLILFYGNDEAQQPLSTGRRVVASSNSSSVPVMKFVLAHRINSTFWADSIKKILLKLGLQQVSDCDLQSEKIESLLHNSLKMI